MFSLCGAHHISFFFIAVLKPLESGNLARLDIWVKLIVDFHKNHLPRDQPSRIFDRTKLDLKRSVKIVIYLLQFK